MDRLSAPFHNRDRERRSLQHVLRSERSELIIMYGRRGVGKSALLREALQAEGFSFLYYRAVRRTLPLQLVALTEAFRTAFPDVFLPQPFASTTVFLEALVYAAQMRSQQGNATPVCVVIDELPYLADVDTGLLTVLQHFWDDNKRLPNLKLFLAGSYLSFMERQVLDENAPLYNRRTGAMKLEPMDYAEAALFFPDYSPEEKMSAFAMLGGMPSYLEQFDPKKGLRDNALDTILRPNTYLSQEPDWLLLEDLRRDVIYGSILRAVSQGERKPSGIARAIGKDSAQDIAQQLSTLQELGLLLREVPVTERRQARSRNSLYFLADNYLDFWYRFVDGARSLVTQELGETVWERTIAPEFDAYISRPTFERACRDYLWRALRAGSLPTDLNFTEVGTWWGAGDREIDVVALDVQGMVCAAGSCKWTASPMDVREYQALQKDLSLAGLEREDQYLFLFARSGFTTRLQEIASRQDPQRLILVSLDALYAV
ncbi:MAG: ATPase [Chthonomonadaceae bacterium]|nr:ATPase [Chthonomonadaceae bacterium]